mmetsp:Transcript_15965/g.28311  ORF Transcript_15965/g.28311 Transcript_15965/m.28311 type:complete len:393 (-) Transcript_15965:40-1218(-)
MVGFAQPLTITANECGEHTPSNKILSLQLNLATTDPRPPSLPPSCDNPRRRICRGRVSNVTQLPESPSMGFAADHSLLAPQPSRAVTLPSITADSLGKGIKQSVRISTKTVAPPPINVRPETPRTRWFKELPGDVEPREVRVEDLEKRNRCKLRKEERSQRRWIIGMHYYFELKSRRRIVSYRFLLRQVRWNSFTEEERLRHPALFKLAEELEALLPPSARTAHDRLRVVPPPLESVFLLTSGPDEEDPAPKHIAVDDLLLSSQHDDPHEGMQMVALPSTPEPDAHARPHPQDIQDGHCHLFEFSPESNLRTPHQSRPSTKGSRPSTKGSSIVSTKRGVLPRHPPLSRGDGQASTSVESLSQLMATMTAACPMSARAPKNVPPGPDATASAY